MREETHSDYVKAFAYAYFARKQRDKMNPPLKLMHNPWEDVKPLRLRKSLKWQPVYDLKSVSFTIAKTPSRYGEDELVIKIGNNIVYKAEAATVIDNVFKGPQDVPNDIAETCATIFEYLQARGLVPYPAEALII